MRPEKILVTGGAGFIGSHLAQRLLAMNYKVIVFDNESTGLRRNVPFGAEYVLGDVQHNKDLEPVFQLGIDYVFHIAGQASNINSFHDPINDLTTNVVGTINILQNCLNYRVPRILYASSMTVYGHPSKLPVSESETPRPISYYGITKYAAERYVMATAQREDLSLKFNATAFRMFNVYGERQRLDNPYQGVFGFFLGNVLNDQPINIHGDGQQTRDFIYIQDVVDAWIASMNQPAAYGEVFNLGSGEGITINKLADKILGVTGYTRSNYPITYGPRRPGDQRHMAADIDKAKSILNWQPRISLEAGLIQTISWAKNEIRVVDK